MSTNIHVSTIAMLLLGLSAASAKADLYSDLVLSLNPTSYFRLDETNVSPTSPASNLGTLGPSLNATYSTSAGSTTATTGPTGGAVPGNAAITTTGFAVNLLNNGSTGMTAGSGAFSVSLWANPTSFAVGDYGSFFSYGGPNATGVSVILSENGDNGNGRIFVGIFGQNLFLSSASLTAGTWNHVGLTYDGSLLQLYMNGVAAGSATRTLNSQNAFAWLGGLYSGGSPFSGGLDEFAYWNGTALTGSQMQQLAVVPEPGMGAMVLGASAVIWLAYRRSRPSRRTTAAHLASGAAR
jgi:hypothetical protein